MQHTANMSHADSCAASTYSPDSTLQPGSKAATPSACCCYSVSTPSCTTVPCMQHNASSVGHAAGEGEGSGGGAAAAERQHLSLAVALLVQTFKRSSPNSQYSLWQLSCVARLQVKAKAEEAAPRQQGGSVFRSLLGLDEGKDEEEEAAPKPRFGLGNGTRRLSSKPKKADKRAPAKQVRSG